MGRTIVLALMLSPAVLLGGCVLAPPGTPAEKAKADQVGKTYEPPPEKRRLPELPPSPTWRQTLERAFLASGDLESAYFEWRAALSRIDQAATWPNSNLSVGYSYMFSGGQAKSWDRTTLSAGFDPSMNLSYPGKAAKAGEIALHEAQAAGFRFQNAKFELQRRIITSYIDLALVQERIHIQRDNANLLKLLTETVANRVQAGGAQQDLLKVQVDWRMAENDLQNMNSDAASMRAMLNAMLDRRPEATLIIAGLPKPRSIISDDARLMTLAETTNAEMNALAHTTEGRREAVTLAKMAWIPDFNPTAAFTGGVSQSVGAMVMLPTTYPRIQAAIEEATAMLRSSQAMTRQVGRDRVAAFAVALYATRNAERQVRVFNQEILPASEQALNSSRQGYAAGGISFADLIDAQRTWLSVKLLIVEMRAEREKRLAEMEALAGVDLETLQPRPAGPATKP